MKFNRYIAYAITTVVAVLVFAPAVLADSDLGEFAGGTEGSVVAAALILSSALMFGFFYFLIFAPKVKR